MDNNQINAMLEEMKVMPEKIKKAQLVVSFLKETIYREEQELDIISLPMEKRANDEGKNDKGRPLLLREFILDNETYLKKQGGIDDYKYQLSKALIEETFLSSQFSVMKIQARLETALIGKTNGDTD